MTASFVDAIVHASPVADVIASYAVVEPHAFVLAGATVYVVVMLYASALADVIAHVFVALPYVEVPHYASHVVVHLHPDDFVPLQNVPGY